MLEIEHRERLAVEKKPAARSMLSACAKPLHVFATLEEFNKGYAEQTPLKCYAHGGTCAPPLCPPNVTICGFPCAPFSGARLSRWESGWLLLGRAFPVLWSLRKRKTETRSQPLVSVDFTHHSAAPTTSSTALTPEILCLYGILSVCFLKSVQLSHSPENNIPPISWKFTALVVSILFSSGRDSWGSSSWLKPPGGQYTRK